MAGRCTNGRRTRAAEDFDVPSYRDDDGKQADFHALRGTYLSHLGRSGASVKILQTLARHSTSGLTLQRYVRVSAHDLAAAVADLPPIIGNRPESEREELRATGTDDTSIWPSSVLPFGLPETAA